jgi:hypothetical protein
MTVIDLSTGEEIPSQTPLGYLKEALDDYMWAKFEVASDDLAEVIRYGHHSDYDDDRYATAAVVRTFDGRFAAIEGSCDNTGYSCQAHLDVNVYADAEQAWLNGLTRDGRAMIERSESHDAAHPLSPR